jgi:hypothetical protein
VSIFFGVPSRDSHVSSTAIMGSTRENAMFFFRIPGPKMHTNAHTDESGWVLVEEQIKVH